MSDPILTALLIVCGNLLVFTLFSWLGIRWAANQERRIREEIAESIRAVLTSPDEDTPSPLAAYSDQVATILAARLMQQLKAMIGGVESGAAKALAAEQQLELLDNSPPELGLLAGILPKRLRNKLLKNPQMVGALTGFLSKSKSNGAASSGSSPGGSVRDRLKRQNGG